jgi:hypothetical protein
MLVGPGLVAFVAGATLACLPRPDDHLPSRVRWARRGMLVLSPLLLAPAAWHCLRRALRPEGRAFRGASSSGDPVP